MDEHYEYAVIMPSRDLELHRGPFETFEEAQQWIQEGYDEGIERAFDIWHVVERKVSGWYRVNA